jgi:hypothetical protein
VKDPSQAAFVNLLKSGRERRDSTPARGDEKDGGSGPVDSGEGGRAAKASGVGSEGGHLAGHAGAGTITVPAPRPMPLVLAG